jgi:hypothetical protein
VSHAVGILIVSLDHTLVWASDLLVHVEPSSHLREPLEIL